MTQLKRTASPCLEHHLLQSHGSFARRPFSFRDAFLAGVFIPYARAGREEKNNTCLAASCHTASCLPIPLCHSSSLPFAVFTAIPLGASLYQFPAGLQEPRTRQSGMMRFLKQASLSVMSFSPARFNLGGSVFPSA